MFDLEKDLQSCLRTDRFFLRREYHRLQKVTHETERESLWLKFEQKLKHCQHRYEARLAQVPKLLYPDLPIVEQKATIIQAIKENPVVIIAGETGSGKTTQLPKICLEAGLGLTGLIGHTQPRRLAARTVAMRIAEELQSPLGQVVGYQVRFTDKTHPDSYLKIMTDGILLNEIQKDSWLLRYDCLIIDEAHERSLNIDILLGYLKRLLQKRQDLKIIVTSATLELAKFTDFFKAPLIEVAGRSYPVEVHYLPEEAISEDPFIPLWQAVQTAMQQGPGDILIFQSGEKEIRETITALSKKLSNRVILLPLYARQSVHEQQKVFQAGGIRKIVVATNVAETSITVPQIRFVIDSGLARISRYNYRSKLQRLPIEPISQASAEQRKGRCGRVGPGICYRLYTKSDFLNRDNHTEPEILRTNLAGVILKLLSMGVKDPARFPLIDPLDNRYLKDGLSLLERLEAITSDNTLTSIGRLLAQIPIEPKLGRILIAGHHFAALKEILVIVSALSIIDPRERPPESLEKADASHLQFEHESSDFLSFLNLWEFVKEQKKKLSNQQFKKCCQQNFLSYLRICEWFDVHEQLQELVQELKFTVNQIPADYVLIHKALLTGFLDNIGMKDEKKEYFGARNIKFSLHPSSALFKKPPAWIVACEIVHTTKIYARCNGKIEPQWVEEVAQTLLKRNYFEPYLESASGRVVAFEKVTLFGLPLTPKRKINFEKLFPEQAREIFLRQGLVAGAVAIPCSFYQRNQETIKKLLTLEDRIRRQKILLDEEKVYQFYQEHLPAEVYSLPTLTQYLTDKEDTFLCFTQQEIAATKITTEWLQQFPLCLTFKEKSFEVEYQFDLQSSEDGVTLIVPLAALGFLQEEDFSWLIPGLLEEKIYAYLKALPKNLRAFLHPLPLHVHKIKQGLSPQQGPFPVALSCYLTQQVGLQVSIEFWQKIQFPAFLTLHFKVIEEKGTLIAKGDNIVQLYEALKEKYAHIILKKDRLEKDSIVQWDFGTLPLQSVSKQNHYQVIYYPALVDQQTTVSIKLFDSQPQAQHYHRYGVARIFLFSLKEQIRYLHKNLFHDQRKALIKWYVPFGQEAQLWDEILFKAVDVLFVSEHDVRSQEQFRQQLEKKRPHFIATATQVFNLSKEILILYSALLPKLKQSQTKFPEFANSLTDIEAQLTALFSKHFIQETPLTWLKRFPFYLRAMETRLQKLPQQLAKDKQWMIDIEQVNKKYQAKLKSVEIKWRSPEDPLIAFRWKIEELRLSYFAQTLKTAEAVSKVRLLKLLETLT